MILQKGLPMLEHPSHPHPSFLLHPMNDFRDDFVGCKATIDGTIDDVVTIVDIDSRIVYYKDIYGIVSSVSWVKVTGIFINDDIIISA